MLKRCHGILHGLYIILYNASSELLCSYFSESVICPLAFPVAKLAAPLPFPMVTRTWTDLFLSSFAVVLKTFLTSNILASKSSYVPPLGPGLGGPKLTLPNLMFPLQPCSCLSFIFLFWSHSSCCWMISASTFSCSLLLGAMVCTALSSQEGHSDQDIGGHYSFH